MSALLCLTKAESLLDRGRWAQAEDVLSKALRLRCDPILKADILFKRSDALRSLGQYRRALEGYFAAHTLYRRWRVDSERLNTLLGASACERVMGMYEQADRMWRQVDRMKLVLGAPYLRNDVLMERALVARGLGRFDVARSLLAQTRPMTQHGYWILGGLERFSGRFPLALQAFNKAEVLARKNKDVSSRAFALFGLAGVERVVGLGGKSLAHYRTAYSLMVKLDDPFGMAYGLCGQANAHRTYGKAQVAIPLYFRSAQIYKKLGDESSEGFTHWGMGGAQRRLGRYLEAEQSYSRSLALFQASKDDRGLVMGWLGVARLCEDRGDMGGALSASARAETLARHSKLNYELALSKFERGRMRRPDRSPTSLLRKFGITSSVLRRWRDIP